MNAPGQVSAAEEEDNALPGPGRLLRNARENAGVSLRDISAQLHLDERTVDSLERDDFATLPAPTFVRGYLRGYARLLSVPVGPVLEAYDREGFRPPDLVADISEEPENAASDFPVRLVTWAVALVLLAMVIVWWNNNNPGLGDLLGPGPGTVDSAPTDGESFGGNAGPTGDSGLQGQQASPDVTENSQPPGSTANATATELSVQAPASAATDSALPGAGLNTESPADVTSRAEQVLAQAEQVLDQSRRAIEESTGSGTGNGTGNASGPTVTEGAALPGAAPTGESSGQSPLADAGSATSPDGTGDSPAAIREVHLVVKFKEEAWVQIVDRDDKKLYYNLAKSGQTIDLRGQAPLRVILGRTRGIEVLVDGQRFDVSPHVSKGVARFSLP